MKLALTVITAVLMQTPPKIDVSKVGPHVGEQVPDFSLKDQNGKTCYNPTSVPLSWTLALRPLIVERPTPAR